MRKITALSLAFILLASSLLVIGPGTMDAEASLTTTTFSGEAADGYIQVSGPNWVSMSTFTTPNFYEILANGAGTTKALSREYLSFDTSGLPDDAYITSAQLKLVCYTEYEGPASVNVYAGSWGASRDSGDWGCGKDDGTFLATLSTTVDGSSYYVTVTPSLVSLAGRTQFEITLTDESQPVSDRGNNFGTSDLGVPAARPSLIITYGIVDTMTYVMDSGDLHALETVPEIREHNATHNLAVYEFDTWAGVRDVIIPIASGYTFLSFTPWSNHTLSSTQLNITDVRDGQTYRVYFTYLKAEAVQVHVSIYIASTGEGLAFETFRMRYSTGLTYNTSLAQDIVSSNFEVDYGENYTIAVLDYFGNEIETQAFVANAASKYISIPLDIFSLKCFNQQEDFSRLRIYYNNTGAALTFFCAPMEPVERFLRPGPYTIVVTNYPGGVASASQYFNITVSDAEYFKIDGTTISRVISDVAGVKAMQQVLTSLVTPDMVFIRENLPSVPTEAVEYIHPWSVLTATREDNASGTSMDLWLPRPDNAGTTYTIISDKLHVSGVFATDIWVNSTAGTALYSATDLPSVITLAGENITVEASAAISVHRETTFRSEDLFYWRYLMTQKMYDVTLNINNSMADNLTDLGWFVGWAENRSIDLSSVRVYDVDNAVDLVAGLNYDITTAGLRMHFDSLAAGASRTFTITCYDSNATSGQSVPMIYCSEKVESSWDSQDYWLSRASWTSTYAATYEGQLNIKLDVTGAEYIDPASVVIVDTAQNKILGAEEFFVSGNVITIQHVIVSQGGVKNYDIFYKMDFEGSNGWDPYEPLQIVDGFPITPAFVMIFVVIVLGALAFVDFLKHGSWSNIRAAVFVASASIVVLVLSGAVV